MRHAAILAPAAIGILALAGVALAQAGGSAGSFEVSGVRVDVAGANADAARTGGWRLAQRRGWAQLAARLGRPGVTAGDATLDGLVTGIVVEREQIGPKRYIASLGVLFDRSRAAQLLGISAYVDRSPPMLVVPVQFDGGVGQTFEQRTAWHEAWARFRTGNSSVDYIRPSGTGSDPLLLTLGQTGRPGRGWWRTIVDRYGADDVLIPTVRLQRQWPGGPVIGRFQARYGPDNRLLGSFVLRVGSSGGLAQLLDAGVARLDALYQQGFRAGAIRPDAALRPPPEPEVPVETPPVDDPLAAIVGDIAAQAGTGVAVSVQYDSPTGTAVANTEAAVRAIPGVRTALTGSVALGGISVMRVTFDGDPATLSAVLAARGWQVTGQGGAIRIRRAAAATPAPGDGG